MATDTRPEIIRADGVTKRFGKQIAVDNVSYLLRENEVAGIIGSNGAGKTTFFNLLTGFFPPDQGTIHYKDEDITFMTPQQRVARGLMRTFQLTATFDNLSVIDNLVLAFFRAHRKSSMLQLLLNTCKGQRNDPKIVDTLETFDLQDIRDRIVKHLSLGEKRRLEIAMAVLVEPKVLLLDEPLAGLSEVGDQGRADRAASAHRPADHSDRRAQDFARARTSWSGSRSCMRAASSPMAATRKR